eukprot:jgi/Tetstr1/428899/TSEL_018878.t1
MFMFLAIKPARFYICELHDVLRTKDSWSGRVKMTTHEQLRHDLEWWAAVHGRHSNGRCMYKHVESVYMHVDISSDYYGCGAVLNETTEACGFWRPRAAHHLQRGQGCPANTLCYPSIRDREMLLHNIGVMVHIVANLASRSRLLMTTELRNVWFILNTNDISIRRARCIETTANIWVDRLSRESDRLRRLGVQPTPLQRYLGSSHHRPHRYHGERAAPALCKELPR